MDKEFLTYLGTIGSVLSLTGAFPQIKQLLKVKSAEGQSILAWFIWFISNVMILIYAFSTSDPVFIFLQVMWSLLSFYILFLVIIYKGKSYAS